MDQFSVQKLGLNRHALHSDSTIVDRHNAGRGCLRTWTSLVKLIADHLVCWLGI